MKGIWFAAGVIASACWLSPLGGQAAAQSCVEESSPTYTVRRLPESAAVKVGDRSLADWKDTFVVQEIPLKDAQLRQWSSIRGAAPRLLSAGDFAVKVLMATDGRYWYMAADVSDDAVRPVSASSPYPYSGDCLEVFFAGKQTSSRLDFHDLVESGPGGQAAFFQLDIPPVTLLDQRVQFAEWRTDRALVDGALRQGFAVSTWVEGGRWRAEVRIPLDAFEGPVLKTIRAGERLKMGLDYLDYDSRTADRTAQDNWGFKPDNVFCIDRDESNLNVPACMRTVVFEP